MPAPVLHQAVVESIGQAIVDGRLQPGQSLLLESLIADLAVSRNVAREAVRVLETLGMVAVKRRVGTLVQPRSMWNVMDPRVIRWRIAGVYRDEELDQLMQVRAGLEPVAARLCAVHAPAEVAADLIAQAEIMLELGSAGRGASAEFLAADLRFHRLVMCSNGNDHLAAFTDAFDTLLSERNRLGLLDDHPDPRAMDAHLAMARAISSRRPGKAERACRLLIGVVHTEVLHPPGGG